MPGDGQRTETEDGPWAYDAVSLTTRAGRPVALSIERPSGVWTNAWSGDGVLQASYRYDPHGPYQSWTGALASANGLRFSSKSWLGFQNSPSDGLYSFGYRWYAPYLQRWLSRDPLGENGGLNPYRSLENGPYDHIDSLGLFNEQAWEGYRDFVESLKKLRKKECEETGGIWGTPADVYWGGDVDACVQAVQQNIFAQASEIGAGGFVGTGAGIAVFSASKSIIFASAAGCAGAVAGYGIGVGVIYAWCTGEGCQR